MSDGLVEKSVSRVVNKGFGTICAHCHSEGETNAACCNQKAGLDSSDDRMVCCCSCHGRGYHLLPKWVRGFFTKNTDGNGNI